MFGYVTPDKPNMYMKDYAVYKAFYCGICKCTGKLYGQLMRFTTNYDITFFTILLHNILEQSIELKNETCVLNPLKKKSVVKTNAVLKQSVYLNILLADFKLSDDVLDKGSIKSRIVRFFIKGKVKRATVSLPEVAERIERARKEQNEIETSMTQSVDKAAHPFASMLTDVFKIMCGTKYTEAVGALAYQLGRFIYISDAADDYDKDYHEGSYNPLRLLYPEIKDKAELLKVKDEEVEFMLRSAYSEVKRHYETMDFKLCEGVVTNILWYGMNAAIEKLISGEKNAESV
jgi:hypothetical protein